MNRLKAGIIEFETDIAAAYQVMGFYIHVPTKRHNEAFGQTYVEALAAGIPSIFTKSGIAPYFIKDGHNAYVVPFKDPDAIYNKMIDIVTNYEKAKLIALEGQKEVRNLFPIEKMIKSLTSLYAS